MSALKSGLVHPPYKTKYRVGNWRDYERGLRNRGDVTVWFSEEAIAAWTPQGNGRGGGQQRYSDFAIETALTLRVVFHLSLRQAEGFVGSLLHLMGLDCGAPDHTTASRRGRTLDIALRARVRMGPIHLIVDSTGLEIVGQGQWAAAKHGGKGIRGWRKLHIDVAENGFIVAEEVTDSGTDDAAAVHDLLEQIEVDIERFTGDTTYDKWSVYEALAPRGTTVVVPPSKRAVGSGTDTPAGRARDATVTRVRNVGRRQWKKESGYHYQGRAENTFFRYKRLLGGRLRCREPRAQAVEVRLSCNVLNVCSNSARRSPTQSVGEFRQWHPRRCRSSGIHAPTPWSGHYPSSGIELHAIRVQRAIEPYCGGMRPLLIPEQVGR